MRLNKLASLFVVLMMFLGGADASAEAVWDLNSPVESVAGGKTYLIRNHGHDNFYLRMNPDFNLCNISAGLGGTDKSTSYQWVLEANGTGFKLKSVEEGTYVSNVFENTYGFAETTDNPATFNFTYNEELKAFTLTNDYDNDGVEEYVSYIGDYVINFTEDAPTAENKNACWRIYEVVESHEYTVSSWVLNDASGVQVASGSIENPSAYTGTEHGAVEHALNVPLSSSYYDVTLSAEGVATITEKAAFPFVVSSGDAASWTWQKIFTRGQYMGSNAEKNKIVAVEDGIKSSNFWAIVRDASAVNSFKFYNLAVGVETPMGLTSTSGNEVIVTFPETGAVVSAFSVSENGDGFTISHGGYPLVYFSESELNLNQWQSNNLGHVDAKMIVEPIDYNNINTNKYYRIFNDGGYLTTVNAIANDAVQEGKYEKRDVTQASVNDDITSVFSFEKIEGATTYKIRVANDNLPLGSNVTGVVFLGIGIGEEWAGKFSLAAGTGGAYAKLNLGESSLMNTEWRIEEAEAVKLTVNSSLQYASVNFPFAVKIPEGATAYVAGAHENGVISLEEGWVAGDVMPANSPVLIYKENGGELSFEIQAVNATNTTANRYGSNSFRGTTARKALGDTESWYALTKNEAGEPVMRKAATSSGYFPANKAYFPIANTAEGSATLKFVFGGLTDIESAVEENNAEAEVYYDLNGRRVLYPSNGIFVTGNGKKVFIR